MRRVLFLLGAALIIVNLPFALEAQAPAAKEVTFSRDVAPILYSNCIYCHRPNDIAPFSLLSYKDARPWSKSMKEQVVMRRMPPWGVDPHVGDFRNNKSLSERDIQTIAAWVDGGAKEGNAADMPKMPQFDEGWQIGTPDLVVKMTEPYKIPATGTVPYVTLPTDYVFPEDTWVQAVEVKPGNRAVVHHAMTQLGETGSVSDGPHMYSPGIEAMIWRDGYGKLIPKGTRVYLQLHYNVIGKETTDQTSIAFKFAKVPVHTEVHQPMSPNQSLLIPPMVQGHEVVTAFVFPTEARLHAFRPHMHVRGANVSVTLVMPDGKRRPMFNLPKWDDSWQYFYMLQETATVPKGAFLEVVANFDNSPANPLNPDPKSPVAWGQQVWEEMLNFYPVWTAVNDANRNDTAPIQIPPSKLFTTGVAAGRN